MGIAFVFKHFICNGHYYIRFCNRFIEKREGLDNHLKHLLVGAWLCVHCNPIVQASPTLFRWHPNVCNITTQKKEVKCKNQAKDNLVFGAVNQKQQNGKAANLHPTQKNRKY